MITIIRRAPNGASRALSSLARPSHRSQLHPSRLAAPLSVTRTPTTPLRFSSTSTTTPPLPPSTDAPSKPAPSSDSSPPSPQQQQQKNQPPPPPPPKKQPRSLRPLIYFTIFLGAGLVAGNIVRFAVAPPPLPDAGTEMDEALQGKLREELDRLPVVREFEDKATAESGGPIGGGDAVGAEWVEVEPWGVGMPASSSSPLSPSLLATAAEVLGGGRSRRDSGVVLLVEEERDGKLKGGGGWFGGWGASGKEQRPAVAVPQTTMMPDEKHMVAQTLAAMKGFGPARRWVNRATRESVTVFWVGGGLTGWPGVAHGGALATAFCEAFGGKVVL
ncbi:hypothetical protein BK809_0001856 [Diplodia seriata]|uniref:Uncharacterized protein n=1 Tax=Diplodia seriata TaxID=420778 RepID=A0A1S8BBN5_9PEZI|nr:hypothetical protein BK809_0001856 [Diplodia seriata]